MNLSQSDIFKHVAEVLGEMTEVKGVEITIDLNPLESLALDSGNGIEFALEMEDRLAIVIPVEENPFVKGTTTPCARTVGEIAEFLFALSTKQEAKK